MWLGFVVGFGCVLCFGNSLLLLLWWRCGVCWLVGVWLCGLGYLWLWISLVRGCISCGLV